ncbi:hypothetical protein RUM43_007227, partial [Polyplax serrata]
RQLCVYAGRPTTFSFNSSKYLHTNEGISFSQCTKQGQDSHKRNPIKNFTNLTPLRQDTFYENDN